MNAPLAERMRPKTIDDVIGQEHLVGEQGTIRKFLTSGNIPSIIFWGPPGVGKTTMARVIAESSGTKFYKLSAISSGVKDIREIISRVKNEGMFGTGNAILFIDEIHRFSKSQQDSLLEAVEKGQITLIGATTENPSFEVISALLSRCQVFVLKSLEKSHLDQLLMRVLNQDSVLKTRQINILEKNALFRISGGDARKLLNSLETVALSSPDSVSITDELVLSLLNEKMARYDKTGENHYDIVSAFIKSIRGSDPHASVYWLARMVEGGEDAKFIARRLVILASEDIGNANPTALVLANNCFQAVSVIGWPESRIILSQCVNYLATSPKSNSVYSAISDAQQLVRETGDLSVPLHLRNAPTSLMKDLGYGQDYSYPHDQANSFSESEYLPKELSGRTLYTPGDNTREKRIKEEMDRLWKNKYY